MANILAFEKVTALPGTLTPSTVYLLKNGTGFDLYISDSTGAATVPLNIPTSTPQPSYINSITAGTLTLASGENRWYSPVALTINTLEMFISAPATGADIHVTVNKNGVAQGSYILTAATYYMTQAITGFTMAAGDYLTYDITQIGSTTPGTDLQIRLTY